MSDFAFAHCQPVAAFFDEAAQRCIVDVQFLLQGFGFVQQMQSRRLGISVTLLLGNEIGNDPGAIQGAESMPCLHTCGAAVGDIAHAFRISIALFMKTFAARDYGVATGAQGLPLLGVRRGRRRRARRGSRPRFATA